MLKKLFSHSIIYGLAPQISAVAGLVALPIITKYLTELDFGIWGLLMAYVGTLQAFSLLGINVVLSNSFFKMPFQHKWLWRQVYGFLIIWAIPFNLILAGLLYWVMPEEAENNALLLIFLLLLPKAIFGPTALIGTYYYQLNQKPLPIAIRSAFFGILTVLLNVYTIAYLKMGYMGWAWSVFIVQFFMNASYWIPLNVKLGYKPIFNFKIRTIKNALKVGIPTIPHTYSAFLLDASDRLVMDQLSTSTGEIGQFDLAAKFGLYFRTIVGAMNTAVGPLMLKAYKEKNDAKARDLVFVLQIVMIFITFLFSIWSKEIFYVLIKNDTLNKVYPLSIIIVMAINYRPMYIGALTKLFYLEKTELLWRVSFIAGGTNLLLNFILIPIFGFKIAAFTTFGSLMYMGFSGHFIKKIKQYNKVKYYPIAWLSLIIVLTAIAYTIVEFSVTFKLTFTVVAVLILSYIGYYYKSYFIKMNQS